MCLLPQQRKARELDMITGTLRNRASWSYKITHDLNCLDMILKIV